MTKTVIKIPRAALKMPAKIGDKIIRVQEVQSKMTGNTYFPTGWIAGTVTQGQFNTDVAALVTAETNVKNKVPGAVPKRDAAFLVVKSDLAAIMAMVQLKVNSDPANGATIIEACGFFVKGTRGGQKRQNAAFNTEILGTVLLTAEGTGYHEWQMSKDKVTIVKHWVTSMAHTKEPGFVTGEVWYFRMKKVDTKKKTYNWCEWIQLIIGPRGRAVGSGKTHGSAGTLSTQ